MHKVNIESLDLNLLVPLKALLEERHVTNAAEKVGLSQPAMSRALQRLRDMFDDPLLVRGTGGRMTLTARASDLYRPLHDLMQGVGQLIAPPATEPSEMRGEVVIATRDYELVAIMPPMISRVTAQAPGLTLNLVSMVGDDLSPLEENQVDFVVAGTDRMLATLSRSTLKEESFICVLAADAPDADAPWTLARYLELKHCVVSFSKHPTPGIVDRWLSERGETRNVRVRVPSFLAAAHIVAASDLVVTLPRTIGLRLAEQGNLVTRELPFQVPSFHIFLYWNIRNQTNPIHAWLRKMFVD